MEKLCVTEKELLNGRRVRISISLNRIIYDYLKKLIKEEEIVDDKGNPYRISWLIEDVLVWVFSNEKRLEQFLDETYEEV